MEISRASLPSPASNVLTAVRALRNGDEQGVVRATSESIGRQVQRDRAESQRDPLRAVREMARAQEGQTKIAGRIQFEVVDDAKVMKVLDSKDVLIYQVPSKGQLTLIKAQEIAERREAAMA